jgi:hypothetical protein
LTGRRRTCAPRSPGRTATVSPSSWSSPRFPQPVRERDLRHARRRPVQRAGRSPSAPRSTPHGLNPWEPGTECFVIAECMKKATHLDSRGGGAISTPGDEIDGEAGICSAENGASSYALPESCVIDWKAGIWKVSNVLQAHGASRALDALPVGAFVTERGWSRCASSRPRSMRKFLLTQLKTLPRM